MQRPRILHDLWDNPFLSLQSRRGMRGRGMRGMYFPERLWQQDDVGVLRLARLPRQAIIRRNRPSIRMQYGLCDTPLTNALEGGEFNAAEELILQNTVPDYLDEGPFDRIPLVIVLTNDPVFRQFPRNLRLARLLVERGADPNLRIAMAEMQRSSPSPMELLVKFCEETLKISETLSYVEQSETYHEVIGLENQDRLNTRELKEQLLNLLDVFLAYGGNPNGISTYANSTVYHMALRNPEPSMELILRLCDAGGDLNQANVHRTTPLMDLVTYAEFDTALDILKAIRIAHRNINSLNLENCCLHTALWRAMLSGSPRVAIQLLKIGANLNTRGLVSKGAYLRSKQLSIPVRNTPWSVSAIYTPLLGNSAPYVHFGCVTNSQRDSIPVDLLEFNVDLFNKVMAYSIHPLVDYLATVPFLKQAPAVEAEFKTLVNEHTDFNVEDLISPICTIQEVMDIMFGHMTAGLQQMCVRQILCHIVRNAGIAVQEACGDTESDENEEHVTDHWNLVQKLNLNFIRCLVTKDLKLPSALVWRFNIEAARLQIGTCLFILETVECFQGCDGGSDEDSTGGSLESNVDNDMELEDDDQSLWPSDSSVYEIDSGMCDGWTSKLGIESTDSSDSTDDSTSESEHGDGVAMLFDRETQLPPTGSSSADSLPHDIVREQYEQLSDISPGDE